MNKVLIIIVIAAAALQIFPQSVWHWIAPYPQGDYLYSACSAGDNFFFAGQNESMLYSNDGGTTYGTINYTKSDNSWQDNRQSIAFADSLTGIVCNKGVYRTSDGGKSWSKIFEAGSSLNFVFFTDSQVGWLMGTGGLYRTSDAGRTWNSVTSVGLFSSDGTFSRIFSLGAEKTWIAKSYSGRGGGIYFSSNNGTTWNPLNTGITSDSINKINYFDVRFDSSGLGFAVAQQNIPGGSFPGSVIFRSTDFGNTWNSDSHNNEELSQLLKINSNTWIITGKIYNPYYSAYLIYKTTDGGLTWNRREFGADFSFNLYPAVYIPGKNELICGSRYLHKSTDLGESFTPVTEEFQNVGGFAIDKSPVNDEQLAVAFSWTNYDRIMVSRDGGRNWVKKLLTQYSGYVADVAVSSGVIYLVIINSAIIKSTDGGNTWINARISFKNDIIHLASYRDSHVAYISASTGELNYSDDGGTNWIKSPIINKYILNSITIRKPYELVGSGSFDDYRGGFVFSSSNAGSDWRITEFNSPVMNVEMVSDKIGYANTDYQFYNTIDGGKHWEERINTFNGHIFGFNFADSASGIINIDNTFYRTDNGGGNLYEDDFYLPFNGVDYKMEHNKYGDILVAGDGNFCIYSGSNIISFGEGKVIQEDEPLDKSSSLYQNYPNPFNPVTSIKYMLETDGIVSMKIYDILGNEVAVLLNEFKTSGTYNAVWDASGYSSGIYFCRLITNNKTETRKMILLR